MENPNLRRLAITGGLFIVLAVILLFWARDVVREVVVLPLSYLIWVAGVLIDYTPQIFFWIILLLTVFLVASNSLSRKRSPYSVPPIGTVDPDAETGSNGRTMFWTIKVNLLRFGGGEYSSRSFHSTLARLVIEMIAYRYRLAIWQVEEGLEKGTLEVPPDIRDYVLESRRLVFGRPGSFFLDIWDWITDTARDAFAWLRGAFRKITRKPASAAVARQAPDEPRVRRILEYMKEELEVPNDHAGQ